MALATRRVAVWMLAACATAGPAVSPAACANLLQNGDFSAGLSGWIEDNLLAPRQPYGMVTVAVIPADPAVGSGSGVLVDVSGGGNHARTRIGLFQPLYVDVSAATDLRLSADVIALLQNAPVADASGGLFPASVHLFYEDASGGLCVWEHGVYCNGGSPYSYSSKIPRGEWTRVSSANLMLLDPQPRVIVGVGLYSGGDYFTGAYANVRLEGEGAFHSARPRPVDVPDPMVVGRLDIYAHQVADRLCEGNWEGVAVHGSLLRSLAQSIYDSTGDPAFLPYIDGAAVALGLLHGDADPPVIEVTEPIDGGVAADARPSFNASIADPGTGVSSGTVLVRLDGSEVTALFDAQTGTLSFDSPRKLAAGPHLLHIEAADFAGNLASSDTGFHVPGSPAP